MEEEGRCGVCGGSLRRIGESKQRLSEDAEDRSQRPVPSGPVAERGGASPVNLGSQFLIETPGLLPVEKWACRPPSPAELRGRAGGSPCLDWTLPRYVKRDPLSSLTPSLSLPPCPPTPTSVPEPGFGRGDCLL